MDSQPHSDEHSDQTHLLQPLIMANKQSSGRQNRQAKRIEAQRSRGEGSEQEKRRKLQLKEKASGDYEHVISNTWWCPYHLHLMAQCGRLWF